MRPELEKILNKIIGTIKRIPRHGDIINLDDKRYKVELHPELDVTEVKPKNRSRQKNWPSLEIPATGETGISGGAYTYTFVYSNKGNFLLKGYTREVEDHLKDLKSKGYKYFYNMTMFLHGQHRNIWNWHDNTVSIMEPDIVLNSPRDRKNRKEKRKWRVIKWDRSKHDYGRQKLNKELSFKRLPNKWIPEFDQLENE